MSETPNPDRSASYAVQHNENVHAISAFMRSKRKTVDLPLDPVAFTKGVLEWSSKYVMNTFTRQQVLEGMTQAFENARSEGPQACMSLPEKPSAAGVVNGLAMTYTPTRGKNRGKSLNLCLHGLAAYRRAMKRAEAAGQMANALRDGTAFYAAGVFNADGEHRPYTSEQKARKAWARNVHGDDWWQTDKASRLSAAVVSQNPEDLVLPSTQDMTGTQAISVAKKAGAPTKTTTGKGAGNRSKTWLVDNGHAC